MLGREKPQEKRGSGGISHLRTLAEAGSGKPTAISVHLPQLGTILSHAFELQKNGNAETTIKTAITRLKRLAHLCNIDNPEEVKATLAVLKCKNSTKDTIVNIYTGYLKHIGKTWKQPQYKRESTIPFIPTEAEIDSLIASARPKTATLLQTLKETGARIGEIETLQWTQIDQERKTIYIVAEKGSNSRLLPMSNKLIAMLNSLPKTNTKVFNSQKHGLRTNYELLRKNTAKKLNNPRLKQIHFHTFRHWKGTMEYHKTKDIIHVKQVLGHKDIESTMIYINIEQALFLEANDQFTCKATKDINEIKQLIEAGFEKMDEIDGIKLYRKRK
jgi:integrase/recombinase XerD